VDALDDDGTLEFGEDARAATAIRLSPVEMERLRATV
jgi:hypothetical protein